MTNKYIKNQINSRFKDAFGKCEANGLISSKKSAASTLGISPQLLSEVLNDRINVSTEMIHKFCCEYGYNVQDIFFGKDSNEQSSVNNSKLLKVNFGSNYWKEISSAISNELSQDKKAVLPKCFLLPNIYGVNVEAYAFIIKEPHMIPLLSPKMTVIGAKVNNISSIVNGQVYVIENKKMQISCRRLFWIDKQKGIVEMMADNPDYPSIECNINEIKGLYRVISFLGFDLNKNTDYSKKSKPSAAK